MRKPRPFKVRGFEFIRCEQQGVYRFFWTNDLDIEKIPVNTWKQSDWTRFAAWMQLASAWCNEKPTAKRGKR